MQNIINNTVKLLILTALCFLPVATMAQVSAQASKTDVCKGIGLAGADCDPATAGNSKIQELITKVITVLSYVMGIVAVIMVIIGGFKYAFSQGDANSITSAKNTILYALVGLAIALLAQVIVRFVINKV